MRDAHEERMDDLFWAKAALVLSWTAAQRRDNG